VIGGFVAHLAIWRWDHVVIGRFGDVVIGMPRALHEAMSQADDLQQRTRVFALEVIRFVGTIPTLLETRRIKSQLIDASEFTAKDWRLSDR